AEKKEKKTVNRYEHMTARIQQLTSSVLLPCDTRSQKERENIIGKKLVNRHEHMAARIQQLTSSGLLPCDMVRSPKRKYKRGK
ncbi:19002_t:CDS:1, partial [Gigaspora margarita]